MKEYSPPKAGKILQSAFNLPENTISFTLRVTPGEAIATIEYLADIEAMQIITRHFSLVERDDLGPSENTQSPNCENSSH